MALKMFEKEMRFDEKLGDMVLEMFKYDTSDIYSHKGRLNGSLQVVQIELGAILKSRKSSMLDSYLDRVEEAEKTDLDDLENFYKPRIQEIVSQIKEKEDKIREMQSKVPQRQEEIREIYEARIKQTYRDIEDQRGLRVEADISLRKEVAGIGLTLEQQLYITGIEKRINQYVAEQRVETAESGRQIEVLANAANYLKDPISIALLKKLNSKRDVTSKYTAQIHSIQALIDSYKTEKEGVEKEMKRQIEAIASEVEEFSNKTRAGIIELERENIGLETDYDVKKRDLKSMAMDIEKDVRERIRTYHRKEQATSFVKNLIEEEIKSLEEKQKEHE